MTAKILQHAGDDDAQTKRHDARVVVANMLESFINTTTKLQTGDPELTIVYDAHVMLCSLILRLNQLERACASLVVGVEELEAEWPTLELPSEGRHNDLIGFLFATLPLSQKALK